MAWGLLTIPCKTLPVSTYYLPPLTCFPSAFCPRCPVRKGTQLAVFPRQSICCFVFDRVTAFKLGSLGLGRYSVVTYHHVSHRPTAVTYRWTKGQIKLRKNASWFLLHSVTHFTHILHTIYTRFFARWAAWVFPARVLGLPKSGRRTGMWK